MSAAVDTRFFDACRDTGASAEQGVIIPRANAGDLMLREDVIEACRKGEFAIYAVASVHEALEVLTGMTAGEADAQGDYPEESLLWLAQKRAAEFWQKTLSQPSQLLNGNSEDD